MAVCAGCRADYFPNITVCPACGLALDPEPPPPEPASVEGFVPFLTGSYPEGMAAAASLEAAGLETRLSMMNFNVYLPAPMHVTVLVRERDLDAAAAALRRPPPPPPQGPACIECGAPATIHETARRHDYVGTLSYCAAHASIPGPIACSRAPNIDEDIAKVVEALAARDAVRTVCSCSGSHPGSREGFISLAPMGTEGAAIARFDAFVTLLQERVRTSALSGRIAVDWSAEHGAEINLIEKSRAREAWDALARLLAEV